MFSNRTQFTTESRLSLRIFAYFVYVYICSAAVVVGIVQKLRYAFSLFSTQINKCLILAQIKISISTFFVLFCNTALLSVHVCVTRLQIHHALLVLV